MPHRFYYLRGAFGEAGLLDTHRDAIEQVLLHGYTSKNIEKLQGYDVYSIRLGDAARLLFTTISYGEEDYLLALDYLPNHEYEKSKFLKYRVLERYREQATQVLATRAWDDRTCQERFKKIRPDISAPKHVVLDYYQGEYLNLNASQEEVLRLRLPAIVSGAAGSGKSCVALSLLREYQIKYPDVPLLYVATSKALVNERCKDWLQLPNSHTFKTEFKDFDALVQESSQDISRIVGKEDFLSWYLTYLKVQKVKDKQYMPLDGDLVYEEFRICSGYELSAYLTLGISQCLVDTPRRDEIYQAFIQYKSFLEKHNLVDSAFYRFPLDFRRYGVVVVDEAQDMSYGQVEQLYTMADRAQIVFCLDGHQRLYDRRSILPYLRSRFRIDEDSRCVGLPQTYRCAPEIAHVANQILSIKHAVLGGKIDKRDFSHLESRVAEMKYTGFVHVVHPRALLEMGWSRELGGSTQCVAVTRPEYKAEVKKLLGLSDEMIYTPSEIKGLESEVVIAWKLLDSNILKAVRPFLTEMGCQEGELHRAKKTSEHEDLVQYFNALYTTYTRAKTRLLICEEHERHTELVFLRLQMHAQQLPLTLHLEASSSEEWLGYVKKLWQQQLTERAHGIYLQKVGGESAYLRQLAIWASVVEKTLELPRLPERTPDTKVFIAPPTMDAPIEKRHAQLLYENFSIETLDEALEVCNIEKLLRGLYLENKGQYFSLLNFIQKDIKRTDAFFSWIANDVKRLQQINLFRALRSDGLDFKFRDGFNRKIILYKKLQKKFSDLNAMQLGAGMTPVHITVQYNWLNELDDLHRLGANLNALDFQGGSPVYVAAFYGREDMLLKLYHLKADLNIPNRNGTSPIQAAIQKRKLGILVHLKNMKVDIHQSTKGVDLAHIACVKGYLEIIDILFKWGVDFNKPNLDGVTPVGFAALNGDMNTLAKLRDYKIDLNHADHFGDTPVFYATLKGHVNVVIQLSQWGANMTHSTKIGCNLFHYAAQNNILSVMDLFCQLGVNINQENDYGITPILKATQKGHVKSVLRLYELGANLNCLLLPDGWGLMHIAAENGDIAMLSQLHALGMDLNLQSSQGIMPIHQALQFGKINAIIHLKELGVNPKVKITFGMTLVHLAALFGQTEILPVFLEWGLDLNQENLAGETPIFYAAQAGHVDVLLKLQALGLNIYQTLKHGSDIFHVAAFYGKDNIIEALFKEGMNINAVNHKGETYLFKAIQNGNIHVLEKLKSLGASINLTRCDGSSLLHSAAYYGKTSIVKRLFEWGLDKEIFNLMGETAIYMAVQCGHLETLTMMYEMGCSLHHIRKDGTNLLHIAAYCGHLEILEVLLKWGMDINQANIHNHETIMMYAVNSGQMHIFLKLLELDLNPEQTSKLGNNVAHIAAKLGHLNLLMKFAELKINLDLINHNGVNPLFMAAQNGYFDVVKFLFPFSAYDAFIVLTSHGFIDYFPKEPKLLERVDAWLHQYRSAYGESCEQIIIYPHDIAEMMGHTDVVAYLKKNVAQEKIMSPGSFRFFSSIPEHKAFKETKAFTP